MEKKKNCGCGCKNLRLLLRDFCIQQFPFIAEDFDALTTYEILQKVICYLKEIGAATVEMQGIVQELLDWFENLDVQDEINNKLDQMFEDGQLSEIIEKWFDDLKKIVYVNAWGAVGDGITDDTEAIQTAIDSNTDAIFIFYGKYKISDTINCVSKVLELGGSEFIWDGGRNTPAFKITNISGENRCVIRDGRINGNNKLDIGITVNGFYNTIENIHIVNCIKKHIIIGDENETPISAQNLITNCVLQNAIDTANPNNVGGSDVNNTIGIDIYNNDNQFQFCDILGMHTGIRINRSGNIFTNMHISAVFTRVFPEIQECTAVEIIPSSTTSDYFNIFGNIYFDNWKNIFYQNGNSRSFIELSNSVIFHSGRQFTNSRDDCYLMIGDYCPVQMSNVVHRGSPRCNLVSPDHIITKNRVYWSCSKIPTRSGGVRNEENLNDIIGSYDFEATNENVMCYFSTLENNKVGMCGAIVAWNTEDFSELSGTEITINDRRYWGAKFQINIKADHTIELNEIYKFHRSNNYGICLSQPYEDLIQGVPVVRIDVGVFSKIDEGLTNSGLNITVNPVKMSKSVYYNTLNGYTNIENLTEDHVLVGVDE